MLEKYDNDGKLDHAIAEEVYDHIAPELDPRLIPSMRAIGNVYQEALKQDEKNGDAKNIHLLALWDFHFLRQNDASGFVWNLYKDHPHPLLGHGG